MFKMQVPTTFELKSAQLPMVALLLKTHSIKQVAQELLTQFGPDSENPDFFEQDPLVLDFSQVDGKIDWDALDALKKSLHACHLVLVAVRGVAVLDPVQVRAFGLVEAPMDVSRSKPKEATSPSAVPAFTAMPTMVIDKPLRSGQKIYAKGADLVVLAMVNPGAELIADGNIHVYAPLRGKAMAGARGNSQARIFSLCFEPELVSIAGIYRTSENALPSNVHGKPAQVRLSNDGQEKLLIEALKT